MRWFALSHSWAWSPTSALEVVSLREARRAGRAALLSLQAQGGEVCHWACDLQAVSFFLCKAFISLFDFHGDSDGKESACTVGDPSSIPGWDDPLEKEMATHSSILAWRIPQTEEPGGLLSMGLHGAGHLGLSCGIQDLHCIVCGLLSRHMDSSCGVWSQYLR